MNKPTFTAPAKPTLIASAVTTVFVVMFALVIVAVTLMRQNGEITKYGSPNSNITYDVPLNSVAGGNNANLGQLSQIDFSGRLTVNGTLLLPAGDTPKTPSTGELYYDRTTGSVAYYNGTEFKALVTNQQVVSSVGGIQGNINLGQGLQITNDTLNITNPYVAPPATAPIVPIGPTVSSFQGQTGAIVLNPGTGIAITGTTIANGGVTQFAGLTGAILTGKGISLSGNVVSSSVSIVSGSSDLEVTDDGNGNYTIANVGSGMGGTVALGPVAPQTDNSTNPSIALDKTNTGNLVQLKVNGTDAFVIDNTGTIATGTIAYNQVTGRPTSTVSTLGGSSGDIAVGSGLALIGNVLSSTGSGIASVAGTTNQVNVAINSGIATISLPQDIATNSNVSFNTLTLGSALSVANGGTGATTASQARTNLSAAVSGANGDITSLTNLTAITPIAGLTIGATTQNLTLQGSTTTLKSTSGSFTTTLNFATPTANNTVTIPNQGGTICLSTGNCLGGASGGASTSLNNLAGVAINTSLLPGTTTIDLGSATNPFRDIYLGGTATNNYKLTGSASTSRTISLPDQSGTVCLTTGNCAGAGGGITGSGTANTIAYFNNTGTIANSILTQDVGATTLTVTGDINTTGNIYGNGANVTNLSANNVASGTLAIARGGTGTGSTPTNGQILIGNGTGYSLATISAGANITVTNTAGGISIGATTPSSGAETSLNNLASVAINASLVPGAGGMALGSATNPYNSLYTGVSGSGVGLSSLATVARTVTFQDAAGTICLQASTACNFATQTNSNYYIQSQIAAVQSASSLWLSGTGRADTSVVTSTLDRQAAANLLVGTTTTTAISVGKAASTITLDGTVVAGGSTITLGTVGSTQIVNNGAVINTVKVLGNYATGGVIGTAATTVDVYSAYTVAQTTGGQSLSLPAPANTAAGRVVYVSNIGSAAFSISGTTIGSGSSEVYIWNGTAWVPAPAGATTVTTVGATLNPSTFSFAAKADYTTGAQTYGVATADVNGDSKPDIITANFTPNTASVFINNGNGTFAAKVDYATGTGPQGITTADVNGDSKPDIIATNYTAATASVLINNGNGTFAAKVDYATGTNPVGITTADVNGDSKPDIIVANSGANTASVFINNGNGTFAAKVDYATGTSPRTVNLADVNGDSKPDIMVANYTASTVSVLLNNGNGTFAAKVDYATGTNPFAITTNDVNSDNQPDIIAANYNANTASVLLNNGNGTFAAKVDYVTGSGPQSITTADVNSDSKPDMLVTNYSSATASVLLNNGNGTFAAKVDYTTGTNPISITTADVNSDSKPDIIVANYTSNTASVLINNTATLLSSNGAVITGSTIQLQQASAGFAGVLTTGAQYLQGVKTLTGTLTTSAGTTLQGGTVNLGDSSNFDTNINTGGSTGLVTIGGGSLVVHNTNDSTTAFAVKTSTDATVLGVDTTHQGVSIGDQATYVDGGSNTIYAALSTTMTDPAKAGLILQAASGQAVDILRVQDSTTAALFNVNRLGFVGIGVDIPTQQLDVNGDMNIGGQLDAMGQVHIDNAGNFLNVRDLTVTGNASLIKPTVDSADAFKVQDASGATLLQVDTLTSNLTVGVANDSSQFINNGSTQNTTLELTDFPTGGSIGSAASTVDVYTNINITQTTPSQTLTIPNPTNTAAGRTIYITNTGTTTFTLLGTPIPQNTSANLQWDGTTWILASTGVQGVSAVGGILPGVDYITGSAPIRVAAMDLNSDGKPDMVTANITGNSASVFINNGNGTFAAKVDYSTGASPYSVTTADVNGDSKPDIITTNNASNTVSVLINNGNGTFAAKSDYTTGTGPRGVAIDDVNGDSQLDIIVANGSSATLSVLINNGNGTFAAKVDYSSGLGAMAVTTADFNGDSKPDIITVSTGVNAASVLINNGNGTFAAKVDYTTGTQPYGVTTADVNGDSKPDIIVANYSSNTTSVLINNGNGTFAAKVDYSTGASPYGVTTADVNGDSKPDIIVANYSSNTTSVLINNGNGTFAAKVDYSTGASPCSVTTADVNGDSKPDIIVANYSSNTVSVLLNNYNTSTNGSSILNNTISLGDASCSINGIVNIIAQCIQGPKTLTDSLTASAGTTLQGATVNLNDSSNFDTNINTGGSTGLVTIGGGSLVVHNTNDSTTAFAVKTSTDATVLGVDTTHQGVSIGDQATYVDGGSNTIYAALSTTMTDPAKAGLILQAASGQAVDILRVQDSTTAALFNVNRLGFVGIGVDIPTQQLDVNGDMNIAGQLDAMGQVHIDNAGNFLNVRDLTVTGNASLIKPTVDSADAFKVQDASGATLLQVDTLTGNLTVGVANDSSQFINNGSTQNATLELTDFPTGGSIGSAATTVDVYTNINIAQTTASQTLTIPNPTNTAAGRTIYITNTGTTTFTLLGSPIPQNTSANLQWDGTTWILASTGVQGVSRVGGVKLSPSLAVKVDYTTGSIPSSVTTGDVNGDGKPDILVANRGSSTASVFINNGNGTFAARVNYTTGTNPYGITTADVNGDGKPDILVVNWTSNTASVLINNGNGTFAAKVDYATGTNPYDITTADVNGDSKPDMLVTNYASNTASVFINNGNGTFAAKVDYATGTTPYGITTTDVNGDSQPDIVVTNFASNTVSVFINNGNGTFAAKVDYITSTGPISITTTDVNGDSQPDMLVTNYTSHTASVLINNGNGTFAAKVDYATGTNPYGITTADVNGDSKPDMLVANNNSNTASVLLNNGNGTFAAKVDYTTGTNPISITTADVNGDSKLDIIVLNDSSGTVSVFINLSSNLSTDGVSAANDAFNLSEVNCVNPGIITTAAQCIQGQKTFTSTLNATAGASILGGVVNLNDASNFDTNINTSASTGVVTVGGSSAIFKPSNDSATSFRIQSTGADLFTVDSSSQMVTVTAATVSGGLTVNGHIVSGGTTPTYAAGAAACTTPTIAVTGTDVSGVISVTTGTGCGATGTLATVTFATAYGVAPKVVKLTPANSAAADLKYYVGTRAVGSFTVDTATTPVDATVYLYNYLVAQ